MKNELILSPSLLKKELPVPPVDIRVCVGRNVKDPLCRELLEKLSQVQCGPQLDPELTAYSPQEGLELIRHHTIKKYWEEVLESSIPSEAENGIMLFLPCSRNKPYTLSNQHSDLRKTFKKKGFEFTESGVYVHSETGESYYPIVISEPMGVVPYSHVVQETYPSSHYDCPGFFDYPRSRGWQVTPYRADSTATDPRKSGFKLGPNEKEAQEKGLTLLGVQTAKWIRRYKKHFKGAIGLLKTPAHRKILHEAKKVLGIEIYNVFDDGNKKEYLHAVAKEKYETGTSTYNQITKKASIAALDADDLIKIAEKMKPKEGRKKSSKQWGRRGEILPSIRNDPKKIEEMKREIALKSAHLQLSLKPFYPESLMTQLLEQYTLF